jgi:hypothetical protein
MLTVLLMAAGAATMGAAMAHAGGDGAGRGGRGAGPEAMGQGAHGHGSQYHGWHHHGWHHRGGDHDGGHRHGGYERRGGGGPAMQGGALFGHRLAAIKSRLELAPEQDAQWNKALAESRRVADSARAKRRATREAVRDELAKAEPDLARIAGIRDEAQAAVQAEMRGARDLWLQLYATFSPAQKAVVKEAMAARHGGGDRNHRRGHRHSGDRHGSDVQRG